MTKIKGIALSLLIIMVASVLGLWVGTIIRAATQPSVAPPRADWMDTLDRLAPAAALAYPECPTEDSARCVWHHERHGNGQGYSFLQWGDPEGSWSWQSPLTPNPE